MSSGTVDYKGKVNTDFYNWNNLTTALSPVVAYTFTAQSRPQKLKLPALYKPGGLYTPSKLNITTEGSSASGKDRLTKKDKSGYWYETTFDYSMALPTYFLGQIGYSGCWVNVTVIVSPDDTVSVDVVDPSYDWSVTINVADFITSAVLLAVSDVRFGVRSRMYVWKIWGYLKAVLKNPFVQVNVRMGWQDKCSGNACNDFNVRAHYSVDVSSWRTKQDRVVEEGDFVVVELDKS